MEYFYLFANTFILRPYVFIFLGVSLYGGQKLLGWQRTGRLFGLTWGTAFICEYASTRIGIPFGEYFYTGSTQDQELYLSNIPFMDSLSFSFLLFASYCLALVFVLPPTKQAGRHGWRFDQGLRTSWPVVGLTVVFFTFSDVVIDPVALQGDRWFLGKIYGYPQEAVYFGIPLANFAGWAVVGFLSLLGYRWLERGPYASHPIPREVVKWELLLGIGLYYGVLAFNLTVTFWIGEMLMGIVGCFIFFPLTAVLLSTLWRGWSYQRIGGP
ncbi:MAG: carotenoid biosynthesis protein [Nitrospira sp.]|nr:carotenoid biosynthesis protein [Nitrospira sp.]HBP89721.1 carotenoid biosynthesis protein [Nitrospiraceae bacterium]HNP29617.1 carotenoid biosynthesis protein [Nitrospirales bacterium]